MASTIASLADTQSLSEIDRTWTNQTVTLTDNTDYTLQNDGYCSVICSALSSNASNPADVVMELFINGLSVIEASSRCQAYNSKAIASQYVGFLMKGTIIKVKASERHYAGTVTRTLRIIHK